MDSVNGFCAWNEIQNVYIFRLTNIRTLSGAGAASCNTTGNDTKVSKEQSGPGLYVVGQNDKGELGIGSKTHQDNVVKAEWANDRKIVWCSHGYQWWIRLTDKGKVFFSGFNNEAQGGMGNKENCIISASLNSWYDKSNVVAVSVSDALSSDSCVIIDDKGQCYGHGLNNNGQLGIGNTNKIVEPQKITFFEDKVVVDASCAYKWNVWVTAKGRVYTSGLDEYGGLGFAGNTTKLTTPKLVEHLRDKKFVQVSCGCTHMLLLQDDGNVWSAGRNQYGQLGHGHKTENKDFPKVIEYFRENNITITTIRAGFYFGMALSDQGKS